MRTRFVRQLRRGRRHRHADRHRGAGPHDRVRALRRDRARRRGAHRGATRAHDAPRRGRRRRGKLPVVLKRGAGGVLFHEACGHGLEADLVGKDASVFRGQVGEQVASPLVTLVDDGTYAREWGTYAIDDEGAPAQRNVLIENGVLTDYMWDLLRARKDGRASSGQRSARDLPAPADGADDQHVPARGRRRSRRHRPRHRARPLLRRARRRPGRTPPPATSCSASPRRT